ncbi:MAG: class I SAM-dependent methyltransferase [Myxococcales bacterium]|nr:class I SAM-dependent methyltransferase [Myxococcales bacterium]
MTTFWDERYSGEDYAYGTEPNDFLRAEAHRIPPGPVLCLAEGEGRNAVFLAGLGHQVTAVDQSAAGLRKAERLAQRNGVTLELIQADLATFDLGRDQWSGIVEIFVHLPPELRRRIHAQIPLALRPAGAFVLEVYRPEQLVHDTGGPKDAALLCSLADLRQELAPLELVIAREVDREIHEGRFHTGASATVQLVGHRR